MTILSERAGDADSSWTRSTLSVLPGRAAAVVRPAQPAAKNPDEIRQAAYEAGFAEGLAAGRAQAERIAGEMATLLGAMATPFRDMDAILLRELLELTERTVSAVLGRELEQGVNLESVLEEALEALGSATVPVEVVLNPDDARLCRGAGLFGSEQFTLVEDDALERGGLQLRAGTSFVDASVAARLDAALASLRRDVGLPDPEPPLPGVTGTSDPGAG